MTPTPPLSTAVADLPLLRLPKPRMLVGAHLDSLHTLYSAEQVQTIATEYARDAIAASRAATASDIAAAPEQQQDHVAPPTRGTDSQHADGWPGEIYLQAGDEPLSHFNEYGDVSWCDHPQGESDVRYVRADDSVAAPGSATAGAAAEQQFVLLSDTIEGAHPDHGAGRFFTMDCARAKSAEASPPDGAMPEPAAWLMLPSRTTWVDKAEAEQIMAACRHQTKLVPLYLAAQPAEGSAPLVADETTPAPWKVWEGTCVINENEGQVCKCESADDAALIVRLRNGTAEGSAQVATELLTLQQVADRISGQGIMSPVEFRRFLNGDGVDMYPHQLLRMVNLFAAPERSDTPAVTREELEMAIGERTQAVHDKMMRCPPLDANTRLIESSKALESVLDKLFATPTTASQALDAAAPAGLLYLDQFAIDELAQGVFKETVGSIYTEPGEGRTALARIDGDKQGAQGENT